MVRNQVADKACWNSDSVRGYSIRNGLEIVSRLHSSVELAARCLEAISSVLDSVIPYRIKAFGWRCMLNRLPKHDLLSRKGISLSHQEAFCVFCLDVMESLNHVFLNCKVTKTRVGNLGMYYFKPFLFGLGGL